MTTTITFNELRSIKDQLPAGSMQRIAEELGINVQAVKNYFGAEDYKQGKFVGVHLEQGPNGGMVRLDDTAILDKAREIINV